MQISDCLTMPLTRALLCLLTVITVRIRLLPCDNLDALAQRRCAKKLDASENCNWTA